jgi:hypothetical protein
MPSLGRIVMVQPLREASSQHAFVIEQRPAGDWIVRERHGAAQGRFASQQAAIHFALYQIGAHKASALLTPRRAAEAGST